MGIESYYSYPPHVSVQLTKYIIVRNEDIMFHLF